MFCSIVRLHTTTSGLAQAGDSQKFGRGAKVESIHKRSDEPRPRLRQTAYWMMSSLSVVFRCISFPAIRHYGILSSSGKQVAIPTVREQVPDKKMEFIDLRQAKPYNAKICPCCAKPTMVTIETIPARGPPERDVNRLLPDLGRQQYMKNHFSCLSF